MRLSGRSWLILGAGLGILIVFTTGQVVPATSDYQAHLRVWLAGRATGITAYLLLTVLVSLGLILSHPTNQSTWKLSKRLFPWHENLFVFVVAFLVAHVVSIILDPYAGVGIAGSFVPGLSSYRSAPVALGTLGLYAALVSGITGRWSSLLPRGLWLRLHRFALVAWIVSWLHGLLAGTDSVTLVPLYVGTGLIVTLAGAYRYWVSKKARPTFATSLPDAPHPVRPRPGPDGGEGAMSARPTLVRDAPPRGTSTDPARALAGAPLMEDSTR
jgi:sulfoxide reductase heme-binding subunit YedZ